VKQWSKKTARSRIRREAGRGGAREEASGRKRQVGKERQREKKKILLLRVVQTQACTIQPLRMGGTHTA